MKRRKNWNNDKVDFEEQHTRQPLYLHLQNLSVILAGRVPHLEPLFSLQICAYIIRMSPVITHLQASEPNIILESAGQD
jgi:hypothetical protein